MANKSNPFKWRHYQGEIILLCVRWYLRYALSWATNIIRKGQIVGVVKDDILGQVRFVEGLFGVAA
jgi:hypothetical protein